jgi:hypothetical protein
MTSETGGYEAALVQFARGKRLARLAKFVRARLDDRCDACASTLPRLLFGLKDFQTERCYFVGQNCLTWLLEARLVARARFRESCEIAYEREMKLRREEASSVAVDVDEILVPTPTPAIPARAGKTANSDASLVTGRWVRQDGALIFEQPSSRSGQIVILIAVARVPYPSN